MNRFNKNQKKKNKNDILGLWENENLINFIEQEGFSENYFSSESVMVSKTKFTHNDLGFYYTGLITDIVKNKNSTLLEIKSDKDYFVSLDNVIFNKLQLNKKDKDKAAAGLKSGGRAGYKYGKSVKKKSSGKAIRGKGCEIR